MVQRKQDTEPQSAGKAISGEPVSLCVSFYVALKYINILPGQKKSYCKYFCLTRTCWFINSKIVDFIQFHQLKKFFIEVLLTYNILISGVHHVLIFVYIVK